MKTTLFKSKQAFVDFINNYAGELTIVKNKAYHNQKIVALYKNV